MLYINKITLHDMCNVILSKLLLSNHHKFKQLWLYSLYIYFLKYLILLPNKFSKINKIKYNYLNHITFIMVIILNLIPQKHSLEFHLLLNQS
jgi:phosphatidylserine synthase